MSRANTVEEVRNEFINHIKSIVKYWATLEGKTAQERCEGVAFSMLNIFDGTTMILPAMDILLAPHPDDMEFNISIGANWYEPGMKINDCMLHEIFYQNEK